MPIYDYVCATCDSRREHLFLAGEPAPDTKDCEDCGLDEAHRSDVNRFRIVGPVFADMERYNSALLTPQQRRSGMEFKSGKEIERYEASNGLRRLDPHSTEARTIRAENMDEDRMYRDRSARDGEQAALDHMDKNDVQAATGWTDARYAKQKELSDAIAPAAK
jgi:putative FmdB family regulatory protein